ncbi:MAG TPA: hypothetical protein VIT23_02905 [Terrimicrobiaceae bacterium]
MNVKKEDKDIDRPRREKENMDEPQEEFIDISSIPSHPKPETSKDQKTKEPGEPRP